MRLPDHVGFWKHIEKRAAEVDNLKYIAQNDVELSQNDLQEWLSAASEVYDSLWGTIQVIANLKAEQALRMERDNGS